MTSFRQTARQIAVGSALVFGGIASTFAVTVGGSVTPINNVTQTGVNSITIDSGTGQGDTTIVTGTIDNNDAAGWKVTITSTNLGKLKKGGGGAGREILYSNIKFVKTGGALGSGLTDPHNTSQDITSGTALFNTRTGVTPSTATTATVGYAYALKITWAADNSLLSGAYSDTITLVLANDT